MDDDQETGQEADAPKSDTSEESKETPEAKTDEGKQDAPETEQSNEVKDKNEGKLYEDSFGNKLTADQLHDTYKKIVPDYTRKSQELAELKKSQKASSEQSEDSIRKNELLKNVPPDVKEAIVSIVKPLIDKENTRREEERAQTEKDQAFQKELDTLEAKYSGKDGKPKFDREKVVQAMMQPGNRIYDPEAMYEKLHQKEVTDYLIKQALKQQRGGRKSEATGKQGPSKPESKAPKSFEEASRALLSRLKSEE